MLDRVIERDAVALVQQAENVLALLNGRDVWPERSSLELGPIARIRFTETIRRPAGLFRPEPVPGRFGVFCCLPETGA